MSTSSVIIAQTYDVTQGNYLGRIHGGELLRFIVEAARVAAFRHIKQEAGDVAQVPKNLGLALVRLERVRFVAPAQVHSLGSAQGKVVHVSKHSITVDIALTCEPRLEAPFLTTSARVVMVPVSVGKGGVAVPKGYVVPALPEGEELEDAHIAYSERQRQGEPFVDLSAVSAPISRLVHPVGVTDCNAAGYVLGGVTLKLMDTCAGIAAARFAGKVCVTAGIEPVDFLVPLRMGDLLHVSALVAFSSNRSIEVLATIDAEHLVDALVTDENGERADGTGEPKLTRAITARFTFVALPSRDHSSDSSGVTVPAVTPKTDEDKRIFEVSKEIYTERKRKRQADKK